MAPWDTPISSTCWTVGMGHDSTQSELEEIGHLKIATSRILSELFLVETGVMYFSWGKLTTMLHRDLGRPNLEKPVIQSLTIKKVYIFFAKHNGERS